MSATLKRMKNGKVHLSETCRHALELHGHDSYGIEKSYKQLAHFVGREIVYNVQTGNGAWRPRFVGNEIQFPRSYTGRGGNKLPDANERSQHEAFLAHLFKIAGEMRQGKSLPSEDDKPAYTPQPEPTGTVFDRLDRELKRLRQICVERKVEGNFVESARADLNGYKLLKQGIPVEGILWSIAASWSDDTRHQARLTPFDYASFGERIDGLHRATPYIKACVEANVPVWLYGATGTMKSSGIKKLASDMSLDYYELALSGQLASAITGRDLLKRFSESVYCKAYANGGIINCDEFDKSHPLVAAQINNSVESDEYWNPMLEEPIKRHPDFRIIACGNTPGTGPTPQFPGSQKQEDSILDRFRVGMVEVKRDQELVRSILDGIKG